MIAITFLTLFIILYIAIYLSTIPVFVIILILLIESSLLIVCKYDTLILYVFIIMQGVLFVPYIHQRIEETSFNPNFYGEITTLTGLLLFDSTISEDGNSGMVLKVQHMENIRNISIKSDFELLTIIPSATYIRSGTQVKVEGHFFISEDNKPIFMVMDYKILKKGLIIRIREYMQSIIIYRLRSLSEHIQPLIFLVGLGIKGENAQIITHRAIQKGVAHLFALSGMHLSVLISLSTILLSKIVSKRNGVIVSISIALMYLLIAGNKPSLMRSVLFLLVSLIPYATSRIDRFFLVIILHSVFFPSSMMSLAAIYSYTALYGILLISFDLSQLLSTCFPSILSSSLSLSISAMSITGIVSIILFDTFIPLGILYTLVLTPLIILLIIVTIVYLFVRIEAIRLIVQIIGDRILRILGPDVSHANIYNPWNVYLVFLTLSLTAALLLWYSMHCITTRRRLAYEMDISLRFTFTHQSNP